MSYISISAISNPEFINLQPLDISPLMSKCEIKVLYVGKNRNHSFITKDVALEMSKTLRGSPIVGLYKEGDEDFKDHGHQMIINGDGISFNCLTKPYGFVAPDAKVWFQTFEEINKLGEKHTREYLMTEGYLWTEQFPECKLAIEEGRPQSMEITDPDGSWEEDDHGVEFFIINDAMFSKLCILGKDVEPCFEGAEITAPQTYTKQEENMHNFTQTLYDMMQQLNYVLQGGKAEVDTNTVETQEQEVSTNFEGTNVQIDTSETEDMSQGDNTVFVQTVSDNEHVVDIPTTETTQNEENNITEEVEQIWHKKYSELQSQYQILANELQELKNSINEAQDNALRVQKDDLIAQFDMLSDEDKADVITHKNEYSLEEIESKLSVICWRKKVNFNLNDLQVNGEKINKGIVTYTVDASCGDDTPAFITAMRHTKASRN